LANSRVHRPEISFIQVEVNERDFSCRIFIDSEKCRRCLVCIEYCGSGALQAVEQPAGSRAEGA
jgi:ferredoxin